MRKLYRLRSSMGSGIIKRALVALACGWLAVALTAPVLAEIEKGTAELGFELAVIDLDSDFGQKAAAGVVFRGGYFLTDQFEIEGQIATAFTSDLFTENAVLTTVLVNAVYNFRTTESIVPYVLGGIGVSNLDLDREPLIIPGFDESDSSLAYQAGAGSRFYFGSSKKYGLRVDVAVLREDTFDQDSQHVRLAAGFTWRLGQ